MSNFSKLKHNVYFPCYSVLNFQLDGIGVSTTGVLLKQCNWAPGTTLGSERIRKFSIKEDPLAERALFLIHWALTQSIAYSHLWDFNDSIISLDPNWSTFPRIALSGSEPQRYSTQKTLETTESKKRVGDIKTLGETGTCSGQTALKCLRQILNHQPSVLCLK